MNTTPQSMKEPPEEGPNPLEQPTAVQALPQAPDGVKSSNSVQGSALGFGIFLVVAVVWLGLPSGHSDPWFDYSDVGNNLRNMGLIKVLVFLMILGSGCIWLGNWIVRKTSTRPERSR